MIGLVQSRLNAGKVEGFLNMIDSDSRLAKFSIKTDISLERFRYNLLSTAYSNELVEVPVSEGIILYLDRVWLDDKYITAIMRIRKKKNEYHIVFCILNEIVYDDMMGVEYYI